MKPLRDRIMSKYRRLQIERLEPRLPPSRPAGCAVLIVCLAYFVFRFFC
jgi:hypothetical protein